MSDDDLLLLRPEEAARRLSLSRSTVYELMASGDLHSVQIGTARRVPIASLTAYVDRLVGQEAQP